jgi:hypothetical protein
VLHDHGIDLRIDLLGPHDGFVEQFPRADLFGADEIGEAEPVVAAVILNGHPVYPRGYRLRISRARPD